jgi:hypothetical protein
MLHELVDSGTTSRAIVANQNSPFAVLFHASIPRISPHHQFKRNWADCNITKNAYSKIGYALTQTGDGSNSTG